MITKESLEVQNATVALAQEWRCQIDRDQAASGVYPDICSEACSEQKGYCADELSALINSSIESGHGQTLQQSLLELACEWETEKIGEDVCSLAKEDQMRICALELKEIFAQ